MKTKHCSETKQSIDLLRLNTEQKETLKENVARWGGLVRIFVHPLYEKWRGNEPKYAHDPTNRILVQIEQTLKRLTTLPAEKTPPIIVMEEEEFIGNLVDWKNQINQIDSENILYFIPTIRNNPTPTGDGFGTRAWEELLNTLQRLGIRKILLGGMQFEVYRYKTDWTGKGPFVDRCLGIALCYLSKDKAGPFETELSALINSRSARDYYLSLTRK